MNNQTNGAVPLAIRANKLELLEQVADDLAHEIKNPLHSMVINLEVLKRRITRSEPNGSADMLRYAEVVASELERVSQRVDLLLRMVRPARAGDSVALNDVLEEMRELVEVEASRRSIELEIVMSAHGARVHLPREAARQVILNLLLATLDELGAGDALRIEVERTPDAVSIRVAGIRRADTPPGGPVADPFPRGDWLSVANTLGEELGGYVRQEPRGDGVSLSFTVPYAG